MQTSAQPESDGAVEVRDAGSSAFSDYALLFRRMSPGRTAAMALTRGQYVRVLPVASGVHLCFVTIFMIVEASGGSGGTSGVASSRAVLVFFVHIGLLLMAVLVANVDSRGSPMNSDTVSLSVATCAIRVYCDCNICVNIVASSRLSDFSCWQLLVYFTLASTCLAASLGSAMSTFGVDVCEGVDGPCGINSPGRLAKIVFEFIFSIIFGLPPLVAALAALLPSAELRHQPTVRE